MEHFLVLTAVGTSKPDTVDQLCQLICDCGCNIVNSQVNQMGSELTLMMLISGNWNGITRVETSLPRETQKLDLMTVVKRTSSHKPQTYSNQIKIELTVRNMPGTIEHLTSFIREQGSTLSALSTSLDFDSNKAVPQLNIELIAKAPAMDALEEVGSAFNTLCKTISASKSQYSITAI